MFNRNNEDIKEKLQAIFSGLTGIVKNQEIILDAINELDSVKYLTHEKTFDENIIDIANTMPNASSVFIIKDENGYTRCIVDGEFISMENSK